MRKTKTLTYWPDLPIWSFQVVRLLGLAEFGGANVTEVMEVCQRLKPGDAESWLREWQRTARVLERRADDHIERGNGLAAARCLKRASMYNRTAGFFLAAFDERKAAVQARMRRDFETALRLERVPLEAICIPYAGHRLPGWFVTPEQGRPGPVPVVVFLCGGDSHPEEKWFSIGSTLVDAGVAFLSFDQPGAGRALHEMRIPAVPNSESFVSPAFDWLQSRSDVAQDKIVIAGMSFGGYHTPRAAAFEKRAAGAIVWSPAYSASMLVDHLADFPPTMVDHLVHLFGAASAEQLPERLKEYDLNGVAERITCPILILQGAEDALVTNPITTAQRLFDEVASIDKKLVIFERDDGIGGVEHCQGDNLNTAHEVILDWLRAQGLIEATSLAAGFRLEPARVPESEARGEAPRSTSAR